MSKVTSKKIGFIGQGFIGKSYADDFENRGFEVVRYARRDEHKDNKEAIKDCEVVFIAVPTPSTPKGFDESIVREVVKLVGKGKIAVIKSTIVVGTTESIQKDNPDIFVMHSPEFLTEVRAAKDAAKPDRNIIGIPLNSAEYKKKAKMVMDILPKAPYETICTAREAEFTKYAGNNWFYFKIVFVNMLYDLAKSYGIDWEEIRNNMAADPRIGSSHLQALHTTEKRNSNDKLGFGDFHLEPLHKSGRGAGGNCFIKDFAAFEEVYKKYVGDDELGLRVLEALRNKNNDLLRSTGKDLDILEGVYGGESDK